VTHWWRRKPPRLSVGSVAIVQPAWAGGSRGPQLNTRHAFFSFWKNLLREAIKAALIITWYHKKDRIHRKETTLGQIVRLPPRRTKLDPTTQYISVYVKHMADELAELAEYAGCSRLAALFALASVEAEAHPPVPPLTRYPTASSNNAIKRPELRLSHPGNPKSAS
jgi:hypothetical protein